MISNIISGVISLFTLSICSNLNFEFYKEKKLKFILFSIAIILIRSLFSLREDLHINILFGTIIYFSIPLLFFNGLLSQKLFFALSYYVISMLCEIMTMSFFSLFFQEQIISNNFAYYFGMIFTNIILIIIMYLYSLYWKIFSLQEIPKISFLLLSLPLTTTILIINIKDFIDAINNTSLFGLTILGLLFANVASVYIYYRTVVTITKEKELENELEKTNLENEAANNLLAQHNVFLHDIRSKTIEMLDLLKKKEYEKLENYIQNIYSDSINIYNMINSNYKIVDVLINDRVYILNSNNIRLRINLESIEFGRCQMVEMEKIFSSMIDLAINQCILSKNTQKYIYINSKPVKNKTILSFVFSFNGNNEIKLRDEILEILNFHGLYYLIDNNENENEICISILFFEED